MMACSACTCNLRIFRTLFFQEDDDSSTTHGEEQVPVQSRAAINDLTLGGCSESDESEEDENEEPAYRYSRHVKALPPRQYRDPMIVLYKVRKKKTRFMHSSFLRFFVQFFVSFVRYVRFEKLGMIFYRVQETWYDFLQGSGNLV
jgi:hypothetical protein